MVQNSVTYVPVSTLPDMTIQTRVTRQAIFALFITIIFKSPVPSRNPRYTGRVFFYIFTVPCVLSCFGSPLSFMHQGIVNVIWMWPWSECLGLEATSRRPKASRHLVLPRPKFAMWQRLSLTKISCDSILISGLNSPNTLSDLLGAAFRSEMIVTDTVTYTCMNNNCNCNNVICNLSFAQACCWSNGHESM